MENIKVNISRYRYIECCELINSISEHNYAVIKGEPLSCLAYNSFNKRIASDIDILIDRNNLRFVCDKLQDLGYIQKISQRIDRILSLSNSHQTIPFKKKFKLFYNEIDINFDIFWGEYSGKRVGMDEFLSDTIEMDIYGVKVKTLPPLKAMIQLILHHYKDMNSLFLLATRKSIKYDMFKDIYYLLKNNLESISLDKLYSMSTKYEIMPYVYYVLHHTGLLFDDDNLSEYISAFKTPEGEKLLNCYGLNDSERREWRYDFKTRLETADLYDLIKDDLTPKDTEKIAVNKKVFLGE
ncbi:MAG: nucleotidyltransferase family protein [Bacteroidales bacterium]|jgi:hypothetical protein|nr:nucleotidyltransferase family protein [Bacteroidales bacterium]